MSGFTFNSAPERIGATTRVTAVKPTRGKKRGLINTPPPKAKGKKP